MEKKNPNEIFKNFPGDIENAVKYLLEERDIASWYVEDESQRRRNYYSLPDNITPEMLKELGEAVYYRIDILKDIFFNMSSYDRDFSIDCVYQRLCFPSKDQGEDDKQFKKLLLTRSEKEFWKGVEYRMKLVYAMNRHAPFIEKALDNLDKYLG